MTPPKPREWWINPNHSCQDGDLSWLTSKEETTKWPNYELIHAIEYAAYDAVVRERDNANWSAVNIVNALYEKGRECDILRQANKILRDALMDYRGIKSIPNSVAYQTGSQFTKADKAIAEADELEGKRE